MILLYLDVLQVKGKTLCYIPLDTQLVCTCNEGWNLVQHQRPKCGNSNVNEHRERAFGIPFAFTLLLRKQNKSCKRDHPNGNVKVSSVTEA